MIAETFKIIQAALEPTCGEDVFRAGSVLSEDLPPTPIAVVHFGTATGGMGRIKQLRCTIWIHNRMADYGPIDSGILALQGMLDGAEHVQEDPEGSAELILAKWLENSGDLFDPGFRTVTKNTTYQLTGTGV